MKYVLPVLQFIAILAVVTVGVVVFTLKALFG